MEPVDITDEAALEAKRARIIAAVGAARKRAAEADSATACGDVNNIKAEEPFAAAPSTSADDAEAQRAAAMEAKRAEVLAAVAAAKKAAELSCEEARQCGGPQRKATEKDLFGNDATQGMLEGTRQDFDVKDFRMQGNYGHTKFIKP